MFSGKRWAFFVGNSNCEMQTFAVSNTDGCLFAQFRLQGAVRMPELYLSPCSSPLTRNKHHPHFADGHEAQQSNDFPWTVENLVIPTAKKPGGGTTGLALYKKGKTSWFFLSVLTVSFGYTAGLKIDPEECLMARETVRRIVFNGKSSRKIYTIQFQFGPKKGKTMFIYMRVCVCIYTHVCSYMCL